MNLKIVVLFFISFSLFLGCSSRPYLKENSALIVLKTPMFKYADMGFVYENNDEVKVEIYGNGQALMSLKISENLVCMSTIECMDKKSFNTKMLHALYPKDILDNIFRGQGIFSGLNMLKKSNGFTQNITKKSKYDIEYSVLNNHIIFHDKMNTISIKVIKQ
jgi:hypothetical protein